MKSLFWSGIAAGLALGGITQVIAGATEYFVLSLAGELSRTRSLFGGIPPALLGNIVEGNGLFRADFLRPGPSRN